MAGLNRVMDLTPDLAAAFARDLGTILLRGLRVDRSKAASIYEGSGRNDSWMDGEELAWV